MSPTIKEFGMLVSRVNRVVMFASSVFLVSGFLWVVEVPDDPVLGLC